LLSLYFTILFFNSLKRNKEKEREKKEAIADRRLAPTI
jgi:hypothetical protein